MITSRSNSQVRSIKNLRNIKYRKETGLFFVEGIKLVGDAITSGWKVNSVIYSPELLKSEFGYRIVEISKDINLETIEVSSDIFHYLSDKDGPQGVAAVVHQEFQPQEFISENGGVWVGLDSVQDPGNLGAIIRTVDAAGANGIVLIGNCTDPFSPETVRASMGAIFSVKMISMDFESFINWHQYNPMILIGSSDKGSEDYQSSVYQKNMFLLMGSEQKGLNPELRTICSKVVSIPMRGSSDSLNLAIATGIILYEIMSQLNNSKPEDGGRR
jgi:TrmH family RNA methyltransferase